MLIKILLAVAGLIFLVGGGEFLVRGASGIALRMKISPLVVGLTIVAFGTSAPELFISVQSALAGSPDLTMGNVVGSNICNLALVMGIMAVLTPVPVNKQSIRIDWPVAMGASLLLYIMMQDLVMSWPTGILFTTLLLVYIVFMIWSSKKGTVQVDDVPDLPKDQKESSAKSLAFRENLKSAGFLVLGALGLYFGSEWFVDGAIFTAREFNVSERVIGITMVAIGTSLPELVTSVIAAIKKNTDIGVGGLVGSNIFNILSILGITSFIADIKVSEALLHYDMVWMLGITFIILPMMAMRRIGRFYGTILILTYLFYTLTLVMPGFMKFDLF